MGEIWGWLDSYSFLGNLFCLPRHIFLFSQNSKLAPEYVRYECLFINHTLYSAIEDHFLLLYHQLLHYFLCLFFRNTDFLQESKSLCSCLHTDLLLFLWYHLLPIFSHLQWILLKSVFFITDLFSCGVKPFLSWSRCELKFYYYIFLTLYVFFSLSYFPLQLNICLIQSFVLCHFSQCPYHLTFYLLVTIRMVFLNFLWEQPMLSFQKLSL